MNIRLPDLRSEAFLHSSREQIGTWLLLSAYCAEQENSGRIHNCRNWSPTTWIRVTGADSPQQLCQLWRWHKNDLVIEFYPKAQEINLQNSRVRARMASYKRWGKNPDKFTECGPETNFKG